MKKLIFSALSFIVCMSLALSFESHGIITKHAVPKARLNGYYYQGDTNNGGVGAYAIYGSSPCCAAGTTIVQAVAYSNGDIYTATGYTYIGDPLFSGNLEVSNGYKWDGPLTQ